jgi:hypothetical protein
MKVFNSLLVLASLAQAHYYFASMIYGGTTTTTWADVRQWTGYYTYDPVTTVSTVDIRCNVDGSTTFASSILSVAAGNTLGFTVSPDIYHPGPLLAYMAKVPSGYTAANWDGSGTVWFKIYQDEPVFGSQSLTWPSNGLDASSYSEYLNTDLIIFFFIQVELTFHGRRHDGNLHDPKIHAFRRLSHQSRAYWTARRTECWRSPVLSLMRSNYCYWRRKWNTWTSCCIPRSVQCYGPRNFD